MELTNIKTLAAAMAIAYKNTKICGDAIYDVRAQFPSMPIEPQILRMMWIAIDAYADMNN